MGKLAMGTESALTLQRKIQEELLNRGYSADNNDHVMAEYITIMLINDKTPDQINSELSDLIGSDYESNFTEWLFDEAAKAANPPSAPVVEPPSPSDSQSRRSSGAANLFQSAVSSVQSNTGPSSTRPGGSVGAGQKRTASARSPSPSPSSSAPNKARRTDTPTGPRAMMERPAGQHQNGKSLIDRVGHGRRGNMGGHGGLSPAQVSQIQAKIDNITGSPIPMMNGGPPMPMNGAPGMNFSFQEMMMMNMDLMRQMASSMGMVPGGGMVPMVPGFGFPQPGMAQPQIGPFGLGPQGLPGNHQQGPARGGPGHGGMGGGRGRGRGAAPSHTQAQPQQLQVAPPPLAQIVAPTPTPVTAPKPGSALSFVPERPSTPSLCKFGLKCTNSQCRYSHPSPVATVESGMVLSTEFCPQGKDCKDKDCKMGHISPSIVNGTANKPQPSHPPAPAPAPVPATSPILCKFGLKCTRPGCMFTHPPNFRPPHTTSSVQCRFGAGCTRGDCPFQHPPGHVPANMFYRGLGADAPLVEGYVSPHKSVRFSADNKPATTTAAAASAVQGKIENKDNKDVSINNKEKAVEKAVDVGA